MKNKWILIVMTILLIATLAIPAALAQDAQVQIEYNKPQLNDAQKNEIKDIQQQIWSLKQKLVDKYTEFGIIDQEKADKMKQHMETRMQHMEEKGFLPGPGFDKAHGRSKGRGFMKMKNKDMLNQKCSEATIQTQGL